MNINNYTLLDSAGGATYYGYSQPGTSTADPVWAIRRVVDTAGDLSVDWVGGFSFGYVAVWDDRAAYFVTPTSGISLTYSVYTTGNASTIVASWDKIAGVPKYNLSFVDTDGILYNEQGLRAINRNWTSSLKNRTRIKFPGSTNKTYNLSVSGINNGGVTSSAVQIDTPDTIPPIFTINPNISTTGTISVSIYSQLNENSTVYVYPLLNPSVNISVNKILNSGFNGVDTGSGATISITGLTEATKYDFWVVAEDSAGNVQSGAVKLTTTTLPPDITAPVFTSGPSASIIGSQSMSIFAQLSENGTVYAYVLADPSVDPGVATVISLGDSAVDIGSGATVSITGLTTSTAYDVWVTAEDVFGNTQSSTTKLDVTTIA